jgi:phytanoyl-CoA hydroxylase
MWAFICCIAILLLFYSTATPLWNHHPFPKGEKLDGTASDGISTSNGVTCKSIARVDRVNLVRPPHFDSNGQLLSAAWFDQPNATITLDKRSAFGEINSEEKAKIQNFIEHGWFLMDLKLDDDFLKSLDNNIAEAFKKKPKHIVGATYATKLQTLDELSINKTVKPGTRLYDAHSAIPELATLASHPSIHRMVTLLHDDVSVVTQSLYFPYGSMQPLHRDPWYVITTPVESMIACWIALEDIHPDSGPLSFVSDSHQLPYAPLLNTKDIIYHSPQATTESKSAHGRSMMKNVKAKGLEVKPFLAKKGQVFFGIQD